MSKHTYKQRLHAAITASGWQTAIPTKKYDVYVNVQSRSKLFLGKNGALRIGENVTESYSIGDPSDQSPAYKNALMQGDVELEKARLRAGRAEANVNHATTMEVA